MPPPLPPLLLLTEARANQWQNQDLFFLLVPVPLLVLDQDYVIFFEEITHGY